MLDTVAMRRVRPLGHRSRSRRSPTLRAARQLDLDLVADALAEQGAAERRVHADVAGLAVELVRADDAVAPGRAGRVLDRHPGAEEHAAAVGGRLRDDLQAVEAPAQEAARAGRSRAAAAFHRCIRRSPSGRPWPRPRRPRGVTAGRSTRHSSSSSARRRRAPSGVAYFDPGCGSVLNHMNPRRFPDSTRIRSANCGPGHASPASRRLCLGPSFLLTSVSPSGLPSLHRKSALQPRAKSPGHFFGPLRIATCHAPARVQGPFLGPVGRLSEVPARLSARRSSNGSPASRRVAASRSTSRPATARRRSRSRRTSTRSSRPSPPPRSSRGTPASARRVPAGTRRGDLARVGQRRPRGRGAGRALVRLAALHGRGGARAAPRRRARDLELRQLRGHARHRSPARRFLRATSSGPTGRASAATSRRAIATSRCRSRRSTTPGLRDGHVLGCRRDAWLPRHLVRRAPLPRTHRPRSACAARRAACGGLGRRVARDALAPDAAGRSRLSHAWSRARNPAGDGLPYNPRPPRLEHYRNVPAQAAAAFLCLALRRRRPGRHRCPRRSPRASTRPRWTRPCARRTTCSAS